jgi:hypothetical protein
LHESGDYFRRKKELPELILKFTDVALEVTGEVVETFPPTGLTLRDVKAG